MPQVTNLGHSGPPLPRQAHVRVNAGPAVTDMTVQPSITSAHLHEQFTDIAGAPPEQFPLSARIFDFQSRPGDEVLVRASDSGFPLIVRRDAEVIVNFDIKATERFAFADSRRPIYTRIPGFNIHAVPEDIRRPVSNMVEAFRGRRHGGDVVARYRRLPLTGYESTLLLLNIVDSRRGAEPASPFRWPSGKRAVFIALHDVDTAGFLERQRGDSLFRVEEKHQIRATWFIPTAIMKGRSDAIRFLTDSGNEVGWHGHKHDHRDHIKPFADDAVRALAASSLTSPRHFPVGMRLPKLLKSNYLFEQIEQECPALRYDTSFLRGIVPYRLWLNGRESRILEIPTTVPTDIKVFNEVQGLTGAARADAILRAQIARTEKLIDIGAVISIVTHPEKELSERPDLLDVYDQYLSYIRSRSDVWFATAGELYKYWTGHMAPTEGHA
jgi:peptidoglycan/xylan/chitin deacetylase (PgdA/CDA1 family)